MPGRSTDRIIKFAFLCKNSSSLFRDFQQSQSIAPYLDGPQIKIRTVTSRE
ncbi:hypothetical protein GA0004734_00045780 [Rhizobium sp. 9140]|nr:hypothetical protein GA0004734_00045780 [Rhizobium sp. 9140]